MSKTYDTPSTLESTRTALLNTADSTRVRGEELVRQTKEDLELLITIMKRLQTRFDGIVGTQMTFYQGVKNAIDAFSDKRS